MRYTRISSPIGDLLLAGEEGRIEQIAFCFGRRPARPAADWIADSAPFAEASRQLASYFAGELRQFDLPLAPQGTDFQRLVWQELAEVPYGETVSYGELAERIGRPSASRAVGAANGANPIAIVLPCHRVIGSSGRLTGYGGGLEVKRALLALEQGHAPARQRRLFG